MSKRAVRPWVRAANALLSALLMVLFLVHGVGNAFQLIGIGSPLGTALSHLLLSVALAHMVLGVYLTAASVRAQRDAAAAYQRLNARFWAARASGLCIAALLAFHVLVFWQPSNEPVRLAPFEGFELIMHLLLVASLMVHVIANATPLMISLGIGAPRARGVDIVLVVAVLLGLMVAGFVVYYLRWAAI